MIDFGGLADPPGVPASRYVVVIDRPINLGVGGDIDQTFTFHAPRVVDTGSVIVSFLVVRADPVVLEVTLNDLGYTRDYNPGPERTVHEVLGPALRPVGNVLTLRVQSGSCRISDLIIWYQSTRF